MSPQDARPWNRCAAPPELEAGVVHLWRLDLESPGAPRDRLARCLSEDEHARARRFIRPEHGARFTVARGALRGLLGAYLDTSPEAIQFDYGAQKKPELGGRRAGDFAFNISHSDRFALLAFARNGLLGVDIEKVRDTRDLRAISRRYFSELEVIDLESLEGEKYQEGFYNCWTRKEAYVKALGEGLTRPLESFGMSLKPGEPPALLRSALGDAECARWFLYSCRPFEGFVGAVAWDHSARAVQCLEVDLARLFYNTARS